jgi:hypothetical protein
VTRSFFELLDLLRLRGHGGGSGLSIERDTCFVNIVRRFRQACLAAQWQNGICWKRQPTHLEQPSKRAPYDPIIDLDRRDHNASTRRGRCLWRSGSISRVRRTTSERLTA